MGRKMKISDLPSDEWEILSRVPLTSLKTVQSTCKSWNDFTKTHIIGKAAAKKPFIGFMAIGSSVFAMKFDLQSIRNYDHFVEPSIYKLSVLDQLEIDNVNHCHGILLCTTKDHSKLVAWNPYLGKMRWIEAIHSSSKIQDVEISIRFRASNMYTLGYDNNNHNHKILRFFVRYDYYYSSCKNLIFLFEIYDFNSNSWKVLDITPEWDIWNHQSHGHLSLKGNTYFVAHQKITQYKETPIEREDFLLCFDFSKERFGPRLPLPFQSNYSNMEIKTSSCVRDDQLAVLHRHYESSSDILVLWSKFLKLDMTPLNGLSGSFFIDEENKVAVVLGYRKGYIIGEDRYLKSVNFEKALTERDHYTLSSYVSSLVQL